MLDKKLQESRCVDIWKRSVKTDLTILRKKVKDTTKKYEKLEDSTRLEILRKGVK